VDIGTILVILMIIMLILIVSWLEERRKNCRSCRYFDKRDKICNHPYCIHQFTVMDEHDQCGFYKRKDKNHENGT
jgi:hypothetical protein